ncbi:MAG: DUF3047 domain-containing protein [Candidatus Omnitrophota bacterium]|nr:DUF3047 domain-containing protein [Candidatus Omnitrophota bacterium]
MKYRHYRKIPVRWAIFSAFAVILFLGVFFIRQGNVRPRGGEENLKCEIIKTWTFSDDFALEKWEEKVFKGKVIYKVERAEGISYVHASSDRSASALYYRITLDARNRRPILRWKWQVEKFPTKTNIESLEAENEDDFAARVYVIFPAMFITNWKVLEYVWSETIPPGTTGTSPYSKNIKLIVLEQGMDKDKKWFSETRDIYSDYVKLFGRAPEYNVGAIAFMTNTEHTGSTAEAKYADIEAGYNAKPESQMRRWRP